MATKDEILPLLRSIELFNARQGPKDFKRSETEIMSVLRIATNLLEPEIAALFSDLDQIHFGCITLAAEVTPACPG
jgi:hypothetical protein